jgi:hypothetical protein
MLRKPARRHRVDLGRGLQAWRGRSAHGYAAVAVRVRWADEEVATRREVLLIVNAAHDDQLSQPPIPNRTRQHGGM